MERDSLARHKCIEAFASGREAELVALRLAIRARLAPDLDMAEALGLAALTFLQSGRA